MERRHGDESFRGLRIRFTQQESLSTLWRHALPIRRPWHLPSYNPATAVALTPGIRLGPYEVISAIGAGGMGEVYKARDARLQRDVAVKVLPSSVARDPEQRARFEREARAGPRCRT